MESLNDAIIECIKAAGGSKVVGPALFPELTLEQAQRKLLDCLNPDRPHKLSPEQFLLVMRLGRKAGSHDVIEFIAADLGYTVPQPVEPRDEMAELMRMFNASVAQQAEIARRMEQAAGRAGLKAVA